MRDLLSQLLRFAELEYTVRKLEVPEALRKLVVPCESEDKPDYYAVDSGYVVQKIGSFDVLIQSIVAVGREVRRRFLIKKVVEDVHTEARRREIRFAESIDADIVLVDGPLTPYVGVTRVIGVSKDPRLVRYGPRIEDDATRDLFVRLSKRWGEREVAGALLASAPAGSYLLPVDIGGLRGTFFKSEWVLYVEFPKNLSADALCALFKRYPVRLRVAHHLAKIGREYVKSVRAVLSSLMGASLHFRDIL